MGQSGVSGNVTSPCQAPSVPSTCVHMHMCALRNTSVLLSGSLTSQQLLCTSRVQQGQLANLSQLLKTSPCTA